MFFAAATIKAPSPNGEGAVCAVSLLLGFFIGVFIRKPPVLSEHAE